MKIYLRHRGLRYKGVTVNAFGLPCSSSGKNSIKQSKKIPRKYSQYKNFSFNYGNTAPKDLIVICDISSDRRSERDWFRRQLKGFDYIMLQKSVWVGPSPLPKNFLKYVKSVGISKELKILKLAKSYSLDYKNI